MSYKTWSNFTNELIAVYRKIEDGFGEITEEIKIELVGLYNQRDNLLESLMDLIRENEGSITNLEEEKVYIQRKIDLKKKSNESIRGYVNSFVKNNGGKLKTERYNFYTTSRRYVTTDLDLIPVEFKRYEVVTKSQFTQQDFLKEQEKDPTLKGTTIVLKDEILEKAKTDENFADLVVTKETVNVRK